MSIKVSLQHTTTYTFDRSVGIGPHLVRLRPAPHTRTPIEAYSLDITPAEHFINWQQDPFGNYLARVVFPDRADKISFAVGLIADLSVINPFDFFIESYAETYPFRYPDALRTDLLPYLAPVEESAGAGIGPGLTGWLASRAPVPEQGRPIVDFLVDLNSSVYRDVGYSVRMEAGVQTPDHTLSSKIGSCRDSAWLLVSILRAHGLAARFVSGYLVQLASDTQSLDGPSGPSEDFTDLHAWAEVYIPGAGWIGLDPTSALFAGEGHIPLSATPHPASSAPITGATDPAEVTLDFSNTVLRAREDPRVTKPYSAAQLDQLQRVGTEVDQRLTTAGLTLTMGGEPTFVSVDDQVSEQWTTQADGEDKRERANALAAGLRSELAPGALVQRSHGKWYPGEPLPRWQIALIWNVDGAALWSSPQLLADPFDQTQAVPEADQKARLLARRVSVAFGLPADHVKACFEDPHAELADDLRRPAGDALPEEPTATETLVAELDHAADHPVAWVLPLTPAWWGDGWASADWRTRRGRIVLVPGDSPAGARLPLESVAWKDPEFAGEDTFTHAREPLATEADQPLAVITDPAENLSRTALVVEARDGFVYVYLPPLEKLEHFAQLVTVLDRAVAELGDSIILEGYGPPPDPRVKTLMVTPDPGVIEVNVHPTSTWTELSELTTTLYAVAREQRLGTETFGLDGRHSGTGGGNHLTLGGPDTAHSPMITRPDLLVSLLTYWQHHPSLSYLFSGRFIGPTSQAPRVDEGRPENLYELEIAFAEIEQLSADDDQRPWMVDRALRHLLTDITGNTHRTEFCIDKLYSPDSARGRLGLVELRGFEMPPHPQMALVQALLVRALVARFAEDPYAHALIRWGTQLHERFMLPHYVAADLAEVVADLRSHGFDVDLSWFDPYLEFRFPRAGQATIDGVDLELRSAIEPWHVLGEDSSSGATARYVDSSTERLQVKVGGFRPERHLLTCNGVVVPLTATATPGEMVAGVRYRAWKPWSSLHPTLEVDSPLTFDVVDRWQGFARGGVTYHVVHPGGRSYDHPPVNAKEAEARRIGRFEVAGHTSGPIDIDALDQQTSWRAATESDYPLTLDLRRRLPRSWGRG